jgi:tRNA (mo5U34)-methyltransferase
VQSFEPPASVEELRAWVQRIPWYHQIDLGHGIITPGAQPSEWMLGKLRMPEDLTGMSVLDIGTWNGFYAFAAERRGARRVLAVDSFVWNLEGFHAKEGFDLARWALNSRVEDFEVEVLDLSPETVGVHDLVLFLGVLYHMRHPLLALEKVASVTGRQLILETHVDMLCHDRPVMAFYPERELNNDPTNWFGPNPPAVEAMLRTVGFREVQAIEMWCGQRLEKIISHRMVFHAWK